MVSRLFDLPSQAIRLFVRPASESRRRAWTTVVLLVMLVAFADYLLGIEYSLSLFYLLPVSLAAGGLGLRPAVGVSFASAAVRLGGDFFALHPETVPMWLWWNVAASLVIYLFVASLVSTLVSAHQALQGRIAVTTSELAQSIADRRRLEIEVLDVTARERAAIGRELHDELGQHLVATALAAQVLAHQLGDGRGAKEALAIVKWIEQGIAKTRKLARGLLVARIEPDRLVSELEELTANASQGGVLCRVIQQGGAITATPSQCAQMFRIAQEAIGNALRHARPTSIEVTVATDEQATCVIVTDDGAGFRTGPAGNGMGLRIMEHRAQIIGASLAVLSAPGQGTKVVCRLPLHPRSS